MLTGEDRTHVLTIGERPIGEGCAPESAFVRLAADYELGRACDELRCEDVEQRGDSQKAVYATIGLFSTVLWGVGVSSRTGRLLRRDVRQETTHQAASAI